ncbi:restriction endonuclease subunit S [Actinoallomurus soli]|uniref:restriction endonuclease subunit S n=1 Tax=Actinoallomurus soli TaxID=2952535 RepID=UPI0020924D1A|nr:restriction endonuclease subunit S [Actinoallomurus soli]MCO5968930.1 restriction endonuclease subunit S [Actinoallomurus soli]
MTLTWPGAPELPQLPFGRLFRRLERPIPEGAAIVTAYTDGQVTLRSNRKKERYHEAADLSSFQGVEVGDFVVHGLDILRGSVGISDSAGAMSPVVSVCEPVGAVDLRYVAHVIRIQAATGYTKAMARGIREGGADFRRWGTLAELPIPVPPLEYQRRVCDYLDRETARIDTLIEEQQRLIEMLHERRHSLVEVAFCDRMPNARLQNACIDVVDCPHTTPEASDDGEYEAVRTASVRHGKFRPGNGIPVTADTWSARNAGGAPAIGDVLFTREAPAGEACMVPNNRICLGQRMVLLRIDSSACIGRFLLWQIYSDRVQDYFVLSANGSTVANVRLPVLRTTPIWLPNLDEQRRIADELDEQTAKIDQLITESERFIELARERRSALITAAVTGQIDVSKVA